MQINLTLFWSSLHDPSQKWTHKERNRQSIIYPRKFLMEDVARCSLSTHVTAAQT